MRKFFLSGLLALGLSLACEHQAQAWINFKFSAGVNWQWQSGNNCLLWGVFRDGQVPGPEAFQPGAPPGAFPYFGSAPTAPTPAPTATTAAPVQQTYWYGGNPFSTVGYSPAYYPQPLNFHTPGYYGYYHAPSYWYGR